MRLGLGLHIGTVKSTKMNKTLIVRRNYLHFIKKYQRCGSTLPPGSRACQQPWSIIRCCLCTRVGFWLYFVRFDQGGLAQGSNCQLQHPARPARNTANDAERASGESHVGPCTQVREAAQQRGGARVPVLPRQGRRRGVHWPVQVRCRRWDPEPPPPPSPPTHTHTFLIAALNISVPSSIDYNCST